MPYYLLFSSGYKWDSMSAVQQMQLLNLHSN